MKKIIYGAEARKGLQQGLDALANAVKVTLGAKGLPVAIDRPYTTPLVTKDGVSVAEEVIFEDPLFNMGANMIKSVASKTNELVGDGSSTSVVLTQAIVSEGMKVIDNISFYEMKKGMEFAAEKVVENLEKTCIKIKDDYEKMCAIPTISANNDKEIGKLIADTFKTVGEHGFISVEESKTTKTYVETSKGLKFKMAPESPYMFNDTLKKTSEIKNSKVLLYIGRIDREAEIMPALEISANKKQHLLIVCNEIDPLLLNRIVSSKLNKSIDATVVQCPEFGIYRDEAMEDIALVCGARLFLQEKDDDISQITEEDLGAAEKISMTEEYTSFINSKTEDKVEEKAKHLSELQKETEDRQDLQDIKERIARLKGGVARIYVGATSEMEMREKKDRIVDAVNALTVAYKDGVVIGGGVALLRASQQVFKSRNKSFDKGVELVLEAIQSPIKQILKNAGYKKPNFIQQILGKKDILETIKMSKDKNIGYDVVKEDFTDMVESGILDPVGVTISALNNAISVSAVFLSTEAILLDTTNYATKDIKFADGI